MLLGRRREVTIMTLFGADEGYNVTVYLMQMMISHDDDDDVNVEHGNSDNDDDNMI
jgi:hypothetical protein